MKKSQSAKLRNFTLSAAAALMSLLLAVSYPLFTTKSLTAEFNVSVPDDTKLEFFYGRDFHLPFNETSVIKTNLSAGEHSLNFDLPVNRLAKIRISFISAKPLSGVKVSDLLISGEKTTELSVSEEFHFEGLKSKDNLDNAVMMNGNETFMSLENRQPFKIRRRLNLNFYTMTIWAAIYYLLSYKLVSYLIKLKREQGYSRIDIVFLCAFFIFLFIPMMNISDAEKSEQENRNLAKKPSLMMGDMNSKFGRDFEEWFNDRFWGRKKLLKLHGIIKSKLTRFGNEKVLVAHDDWLFLRLDNSIRNYQNLDLFTEEELQKIARYLSGIDAWAEKNNVAFYYIICPDKNKIYGEYIRTIQKVNPDEQSRTNQLISYLRENTKVKVLYLYDALRKNKHRGLLYLKNDTHWTNLGASIGYEEFMKLLPEKYQANKADYHRVVIKKNPRGDLTKMLNSQKEDDKTEYLLPQVENNAECKELAEYEKDVVCFNKNKKYKITVFRDSFMTVPFFSNTFGESRFIWRYNIEHADLEDLKKSDILILEQVERFTPALIPYEFPYN